MAIREARVLATMMLAAAVGALAACDSGGGTDPVIAESIAVASGDNQSGTVGAPLPQQLEVRILGSDDQPFPGEPVTWEVTSGAGTVSPTSGTTNANGIAATTFTLGPVTGTQTARATSSLGAVTFTATATAGAPADLEILSGSEQTGAPGSQLANPVIVKVEDSFGNAVPNVTVLFEPSSQGQANPASASTAADGRAQTAWTLGPADGEQTLTVRIEGGPQAQATATAFDPCVATAYTVGTTVNGQLSTAGCTITTPDNRLVFVDVYGFTIAAGIVDAGAGAFMQPGAYEFTQTSTQFDTQLFLANDQQVVAFNDDADGGTTNSLIRILLPAGSYEAIASAFATGTVGTYTLSSGSIAASVENCDDWWIVPGFQGHQDEITTSDCDFIIDEATNSPYRGDLYLTYLMAGQTVTVSQNSTAFTPVVDIISADGIEDSILGTPGNPQLTFGFTASSEGVWGFHASTFETNETGAYTFGVQAGAPALAAGSGAFGLDGLRSLPLGAKGSQELPAGFRRPAARR